jgi:hypothetical protein
VDPATGQLASASCPGVRTEVFIAGTQPVEVCRLHGSGRGSSTLVAGWDAGAPAAAAPTLSLEPGKEAARARRPVRQPQAGASVQAQAPPPREKKGIFRRLLDIFK